MDKITIPGWLYGNLIAYLAEHERTDTKNTVKWLKLHLEACKLGNKPEPKASAGDRTRSAP